MLYRRKHSRFYYVKLKHRGRVVRKSTGQTNKRDAARVAEEFRKILASRRKQSGFTFGDAALRWLDEKQHKKSIQTDIAILDWLQPRLETLLLADITRDKIEELRKEKLVNCSQSTVNRHMALLRAILRTAKTDWEWIEKIPKVPMYPVGSRAPRFLTWEQFLSLVAELPDHLAGPAWFAASTGLRAGPIMALQWSWLSRDGLRVPPEYMKNTEWLTIPLSQTAWYVLGEQWGSHPSYVFTFQGQPIQDKFTTRAWRRARERAGLPWVRFHDLRHSWASWHAQKGTPMDVVQKLGGWSTYEAMEIYRHHSPTSLSEWV